MSEEKRIFLDSYIMGFSNKPEWKLLTYITDKHVEQGEKEIFMRRTHVSEELNLDFKTVQTHLNKLRDEGFISYETKRGKSGGTLVWLNERYFTFIGNFSDRHNEEYELQPVGVVDLFGGQFSYYLVDGKILLLVEDVANYLEIDNHMQLFRNIPKDMTYVEGAKYNKYKKRGFVTEMGLKEIVMNSRKPKAHEIKKYISLTKRKQYGKVQLTQNKTKRRID